MRAKYPFDIEEIFPDVDTTTVRLPRRQSGSSPQGLTITLLADYTIRTGGWLPSAAVVALLAEAGVSAAGARAAMSRLARRGVLESRRHGRHSAYRLTGTIARELAVGGSWIASYGAGTETWDGFWTVIAFSLPQDAVMQRRALRRKLRWLGCAPLYDALWISPLDLTGTVDDALADVSPETITTFRSRHVEMTRRGRQPLDAWDLPAIADQYESFIGRWGAMLPRIHAGRVPGPEAVLARTRVMDTYRRFCTIDPQLPLTLLPDGWPRQRARTTFAAVYDGLAATAEEHVRAVAARHPAGEPAAVRANTLAGLLAGRPGG